MERRSRLPAWRSSLCYVLVGVSAALSPLYKNAYFQDVENLDSGLGMLGDAFMPTIGNGGEWRHLKVCTVAALLVGLMCSNHRDTLNDI